MKYTNLEHTICSYTNYQQELNQVEEIDTASLEMKKQWYGEPLLF